VKRNFTSKLLNMLGTPKIGAPLPARPKEANYETY